MPQNIAFAFSLACIMGFTYNPVDLLSSMHLKDLADTSLIVGFSQPTQEAVK
jgi:hypothetical protein